MTLAFRTDNPTTPGWYVVLRRGTNRPITLWWGSYSKFWLEGARRVDVVAWDGPVVLPKEEIQ